MEVRKIYAQWKEWRDFHAKLHRYSSTLNTVIKIEDSCGLLYYLFASPVEPLILYSKRPFGIDRKLNGAHELIQVKTNVYRISVIEMKPSSIPGI
jgi:hypothetical protein